MTRRFALLVLVGLAGCRQPAPPPVDTQAVDRLLTLMNERLALMHEVARFKWNEKKPIADVIRERELLEAMAAKGAAMGLDPHQVRWFFASQIEAAKIVQQADHTRWAEEKRGPFETVPALAALRSQIDELNVKLLAAMLETKDVPAVIVLERAETILAGDGITPNVRSAATAPWREPLR